jgi:hypothetical protein
VPAELGIWGHLPRRRTPSETAWTGTGGDREADTGAGILGLLAEDEEEEKESEKESAQVAGITSHFTPVESSADQDRINALEKKLKDQAEQLASLKKGLDERKEKEEEKWDDEKRKEAQEAAETEAAEQEAKAAAERPRNDDRDKEGERIREDLDLGERLQAILNDGSRPFGRRANDLNDVNDRIHEDLERPGPKAPFPRGPWVKP